MGALLAVVFFFIASLTNLSLGMVLPPDQMTCSVKSMGDSAIRQGVPEADIFIPEADSLGGLRLKIRPICGDFVMVWFLQ